VISYNNFSSNIVKSVAEIIPKVDRFNLNNCIKVEGAQKGRNLNDEECEFLVDKLNKLENNVRFLNSPQR